MVERPRTHSASETCKVHENTTRFAHNSEEATSDTHHAVVVPVKCFVDEVEHDIVRDLERRVENFPHSKPIQVAEGRDLVKNVQQHFALGHKICS